MLIDSFIPRPSVWGGDKDVCVFQHGATVLCGLGTYLNHNAVTTLETTSQYSYILLYTQWCLQAVPQQTTEIQT